MTWSAKLKVRSISDGPAPTEILAAANADDGTITSNTEGKIRAIELRIQLDADETAVQVGDIIQASGSFTGTR